MAISTNSKPNSNPRNLEANSPMRRSLSGNSLQRQNHTNTPEETLRSNSLVKEEKENENDHHTLKHFMLPTISVASKMNPSPKKKVLADKNKQLKKSPSVSMNISDFTKDFEHKLDKDFDSPCDTNHLPKCPSRNSQTPIFSESSDKRPIMGSSTKPYDPKTNYLSPRPQFLHYRPNPRLKLYYRKEQNSGTKKLEDAILSESEKSDSENSQKESDDASSIEAINGSCEKECEDASSVEFVNEVVEHEDFESGPISTVVSKETSEEKRMVKSSFFTGTKVIPLLLFLLIACLSMSCTDSPIFDSPVYKEGCDDFARNLKLWSVYSTSYVNELFSSFNGGDKSGPLQFTNLTYIEDPFIEVKRSEKTCYQEKVEPVFEDENELENDLDLQNNIDFGDKSCLQAPELSPEEASSSDHLVSDSKIESSTEISSFEYTFVTDISLPEAQSLEQADHFVADFEIEPPIGVSSSGNTFEMGSFQENLEHNSEISENVEINGDSVISDSVEPDSGNTLKMDKPISDHNSKHKSLNQYEALAITLIAIALIASPVLIYLKKNKKSNTGIYTVHIDRIPTNKTMKSNPSPPQKYSPEVDFVGESCSSEVSSFDKSYSYSKRGMWGIRNEAQSQKRKQKMVSKRESLASSSEFLMSDSPSFGSFTMYERLPAKHGYEDDEVVTPVRRSSRIKKIQVTSS